MLFNMHINLTYKSIGQCLIHLIARTLDQDPGHDVIDHVLLGQDVVFFYRSPHASFHV